MKTDEQLGEIGNKALLKSSHRGELVSRNLDTAFAKAVREAIFADCGEVPEWHELRNIYKEHDTYCAAFEAVRAACTLPLMKRNQESEEKHAHELNRLQLQIAALNMIIEGGQELLTRVRALPEKWRTDQFKILYSCNANDRCANELAAALGESEKPVDPYAELKAAHKAGKVIQWKTINMPKWMDIDVPLWYPEDQYRIKPFSLREHVAKSFPALNDTHVFHRDDFTEDMLPDGWRPLLLEELWIKGDQVLRDRTWYEAGASQLDAVNTPSLKGCGLSRTRRPLPLPPVEVPLEAKDVQEGDLVKYADNGISREVMAVHKGYVVHIQELGSMRAVSYEVMAKDWLISRDGGKTWEPCKKLQEVAQ